MKVRLLILYSVIYGLTVISFCIYWTTNFTRYTTYKGDEFFMLAQFLLIFTYFFYLIVQLTVKRISFLVALVIPILTCIAAFGIGILVFMLTNLSGIPRQYILIYGLLYGLITLLAVYRFWGKALKNI